MGISKEFVSTEPSRAEIDALRGPWLLEFGTGWCGHCLRAQSLIASAFAEYPAISHLKIEDGRGRPLGRSFRVTLWPTLVFLNDGREVTRMVRPRSTEEITSRMRQISAANPPSA